MFGIAVEHMDTWERLHSNWCAWNCLFVKHMVSLWLELCMHVQTWNYMVSKSQAHHSACGGRVVLTYWNQWVRVGYVYTPLIMVIFKNQIIRSKNLPWTVDSFMRTISFLKILKDMELEFLLILKILKNKNK